MALDKTCKLAWIVDTIRRARKITFEDLNGKWMENEDLSGGKPLLKRTFHKWKWDIMDTFGLIVECEKGADYAYYIENAEEFDNCSIENWLLNTYSVSNSLTQSMSIKDRVLLENVPSGQLYLDSILKAMQEDRFIYITYYNYWRGDVREHCLLPLCVKLFRQRWYVVGRVLDTGEDRIYSLDRFQTLHVSEQKGVYPKDFDAQDFFANCFGVIRGGDNAVENVTLKVSAAQANYLRALPMHASQKEVEQQEDYSIFELKVCPTFDFQQELFWNMDKLEVLAPQWLRDEMKATAKRIVEKYKE